MKILIVSTISDTVNAFLVPHIKWLVEQGNEVGMAFNLIQEVSPELLNLGCKAHQIDFQRNPLKRENLTAYKEIRTIIKEEGYELVHVHTPVASFLTRLACRDLDDVQVLYTAHGFHFFDGAPKKNWALYYTLEKIVARWTDGIITMNEEDYQSARRFTLRKPNAIYKIHGIGLDLNRFIPQTMERKVKLRREFDYDINDFLVIYVGELSYRKHQDLLIKAVSMVKGDIPNIKLLLVGSGDRQNEYKTMVKRFDIEQNVEFLGYRKDVPDLMAISDLALSSSRQEGLPVNVMEAMATGLPLVVTDCRGNRDLVQNGKNGFIVGVDDANEFAERIRELYQSSQLRKEFAARNREIIQQYALKQVLDEMKEVYNKQSLEFLDKEQEDIGRTQVSKKVSIIMGIYNCEKTLAETIQSIENQSYPNWELIMCDDGSKDNTLEIAQEFALKDDRIRVIKNDQNQGLAKTLNHCLKYCSGDYIMRHDGDDLMINHRIEKQVDYMRTHECDACGSWAYLFDEDGVWGIREMARVPNKFTMVTGAPFIHPTVMVKHEKLLEVDGYSDNERTRQRLEDYDLWVKFYEKGFLLHNIQEPLIYFREDKQSYQRKSRKFRLTELQARLDACKRLDIPLMKRTLALKPLLVLVIPKSALRKYHIRKSNKQTYPTNMNQSIKLKN